MRSCNEESYVHADAHLPEAKRVTRRLWVYITIVIIFRITQHPQQQQQQQQ